jgi:hypothetical protein
VEIFWRNWEYSIDVIGKRLMSKDLMEFIYFVRFGFRFGFGFVGLAYQGKRYCV